MGLRNWRHEDFLVRAKCVVGIVGNNIGDWAAQMARVKFLWMVDARDLKKALSSN